jgi:protein involved in polysaccharide export with SLBB domain
MRNVVIRPLGFAGLLTWGSIAPALIAQNPALPPPGQAQSALQQALLQNPGLADSIRARLQGSGLTADQIRARLEASGYPTNLLDAYLGSRASARTSATPVATELSAIEALGLPPIRLPGDSLAADTGMIAVRGAGPARPGSPVFGVDALRRSTTQFLPLLSGPVPADYKVGPGDVLVLILTGDVELAYTLQVTREGFILIPQVGQVFASQLTLDQLRELLYSRLGRVYSSVRRGPNATTRFDLSVAKVRANQVYVIGEVTQPGAYQISSLGSVLTALYAAGGVTERGNTRHIEVRRLGRPAATFDLYDYLIRGDTRSDIRLETGDVVFVPVHGTRVQVTGAVRRPAIYELGPGETLLDLVRVAGGFRPDADFRRLSIHRILPPPDRGPGTVARTVVDAQISVLALGDPASGTEMPDSSASRVAVPLVALADGDSVVVDSVPPLKDEFYVAIAGAVNKPGMYPWRPGMTLRALMLLARGPKVGAYLKEAEVARLPADRAQGRLAQTIRVPMDSTYLFDRDSLGRYVGPPGLPVPPSGAPEATLQPYDNVLILKQPDFNLQRTVVVAGEVRFPGTYSLATKTDRLVDVINRAGGLTPQAYTEGIRFVRSVEYVGRINVQLDKAMRDTTSRYNIILQPGDSIQIPEYQPSVKVTGAVNSPGSVLWERGKDLDYYLSAAGGASYRADKGRVSVRYANGEVRTHHKTFIFSSSPNPMPGSEVFVPVRDTTQHTNTLALVGTLAQILGSTIALIYIIKHP